MASYRQYADSAKDLQSGSSGLGEVVTQLKNVAEVMAKNSGAIAGQATVAQAMPTSGAGIKELLSQFNHFAWAIQNAIAPFKQMTDIAVHFTEAIDPNLVKELSRAFRDLDAVLGIAFRPIVAQAKELVWYLAGALMPTMKRLEPLVGELSKKIGDHLTKSISNFGDMLAKLPLRAITDALLGLLDIADDVSKGVQAAGTVLMQGFKDLFGALVPGDVKGIMESIRSAVQQAVGAVLIFAAQLMKAAGWMKGVEALQRGLEKAVKPPNEQPDARGSAVAQGAQFKAIQDLGKSIYEGAFQASMYGKKEQEDPAKQAVKWLEDINASIDDLPSAEDVEDSLLRMADGLYENVHAFLDEKLDFLVDKAGRTADGLWEEANAFLEAQFAKVVNDLPGKQTWQDASDFGKGFGRGAKATAEIMLGNPRGLLGLVSPLAALDKR